MKVLFAINTLGIGGAQKSLVTLLNSITPLDLEIDLLLINPRSMALMDEIKNKRVNQIYLEGNSNLYFLSFSNSIIQLLRKREIRFALKRLMTPVLIRINKGKKYPEEVIWDFISHNIGKMQKSYDIAIAYCQGLPTYYIKDKIHARFKITWMHSDIGAQVHSPKISNIYHSYFDIINCVSEKAADSMRQMYPELREKIQVFYNIIDVNEIREKAKSKIFGFEEYKDVIKICTVGRLCEAKGYFLAIEICNVLVKKKINFIWYVVGEGPLRKKLERRIQKFDLGKNVKLLGSKQNPYPYMEVSDIYIQTSLWEGYCITLGEAKAIGKPIVTTNFSGASEQIVDGLNGYICERNPQLIADKIIMLAEQSELSKIMAENNYKEVKEDDGLNRFQSMINRLGIETNKDPVD